MAGTLNKVMLIGNLGDDVKMHYFEGGGCVGRFPIATSETYVSKQTNERITNTEWHNIVVRNKGAEICEKYLSKGDKVYVEGRLKTKKWTDDKGNERYSTEIQCNEFTFLSTKKESGANAGSASIEQKPATPSKTSKTNGKPVAEDNDDLPF